jgi:hypothetical protein
MHFLCVKHTALFLLIASLAFSSPSPGGQGEAQNRQQLVKGPIVQNVQTDRATLVWITQGVWGYLKAEGSGSVLPVHEPIYHQTELTGLQPGTHYQYDLNESGLDAKGAFTTAPKDGLPFTFIAYGDTRTRDDVHQSVAGKILAEKPSFVLHTGDLISNGLNAEDWDRFFEISRDLLRNIPFYPVLGNHERNAPVYFKYFSFPGGNGHYYSFDWGGVHIAALDTNEVGETARAKEAFVRSQIEWLRQDLQRNTKALTFVFQHHPLYTAVENRRVSAAKLAALYEPILQEEGVAAVFAGHDHNYQHHVHSGLHYIVTGGGGAPLYNVSPIPGITVKAVKIENYVRVFVHGTKARLEAVDLEGKVIESFELEGRKKSAQQESKVAG